MHHQEGVKLRSQKFHSLFLLNKEVIDFILEKITEIRGKNNKLSLHRG
jgi:hypothetical protein